MIGSANSRTKKLREHIYKFQFPYSLIAEIFNFIEYIYPRRYISIELAISTPLNPNVFKAHAVRDVHLEYPRVLKHEQVKY